MIKEFFKKNSHLKLGLQHLGLYGGGWKIEVYNTTYDFGIEPIFEHYILDEELESLNVDFETAIMTPVINWKEDLEKKKKGEIEYMTNNERIKILRELKEYPISTIDKKLEQVEESLNWAIKICHKYESKRKANKND